MLGLSAAADVKWKDPDGKEISTSDTANYVVQDGKSGFVASSGSQTTKLTLKTAVLSKMSSTKTYKCSVTSGTHKKSGPFERNVVVTPISELLFKYL